MSEARFFHHDEREHVEAERLLPWYLTRRLEPHEHRQVSQHLARCLVCQRDLVEQSQLQSELTDESADVLVDHALLAAHRLIEEADLPACSTEERRPPTPNQADARRWPSVAALIVLGLLSSYTLRQSLEPEQASSFRTLSSEPATTTRELRLSISFAEDSTLQARVAVLALLGAEIIAGPDDSADYLVAVPQAKAAKLQQTLKRQPVVTAFKLLTPP